MEIETETVTAIGTGIEQNKKKVVSVIDSVGKMNV